jgi:hypothetical protein
MGVSEMVGQKEKAHPILKRHEGRKICFNDKKERSE